MITIEVGDRVHARLYNNETGSAAIQEFVVSGIDKAVYSGGALPCDTSAGWTIELLEKSVNNLNLPVAISEITAYSPSGGQQHLVGKGENWMTPAGQSYSVRQIASWVPGHV